MVIRATSMALAAQQALENQVLLKPTTETIKLTDDIIYDDMVNFCNYATVYIFE
jgi:ribonuclease P/MRP protein subunit RPP20